MKKKHMGTIKKRTGLAVATVRLYAVCEANGIDVSEATIHHLLKDHITCFKGCKTKKDWDLRTQAVMHYAGISR